MKVARNSAVAVHLARLGTLIAMLAVLSWAGVAAQGLPDHDPELAYKLVTERDALLLDVRTQDEFESSHIPGAKHIPLQNLRDRIPQVQKWVQSRMDHPIVLYGHSGRRSGRAKQILLRAGFTQVSNLGPMSAWPKRP